MKNQLIEIKSKHGTILKMGLWELVMLHSLDSLYIPPLDELHLCLNGEEVEKPSEMEEGK